MTTEYLCDLDGCLFDNLQRAHLLPIGTDTTEDQWDRFNAACLDDKPIMHMFQMLNELLILGCQIRYITYRSELCRPQTVEALTRAWILAMGDRWYGMGSREALASFISSWLVMKRPGSTESAQQFKCNWIAAYREGHMAARHTLVLIEDNEKTIEAARPLVDRVILVKPFSGCAAVWGQVTESTLDPGTNAYSAFAAALAEQAADATWGSAVPKAVRDAVTEMRKVGLPPAIAAPYGQIDQPASRLTVADAKRLRSYISRAIKAACDAEYAGSRPPAEAGALRERKKATRRALNNLISTLTEDGPKTGHSSPTDEKGAQP